MKIQQCFLELLLKTLEMLFFWDSENNILALMIHACLQTNFIYLRITLRHYENIYFQAKRTF